MSVPSYKRKDSELIILKTLDKLFKDVISLYKDNCLIAKKNRKTIMEPMIDNVRNAMYQINIANNLNLKDDFERNLRKQHQLKAFEYLNNIVIDCKFCMNYSDDCKYSARFSTIIDLTNNSKISLKTWIKSDEKQF